MAKIQVTESKLKQIIRESIENLLNEDGLSRWNAMVQSQQGPNDQQTEPSSRLKQYQTKQQGQAATAQQGQAATTQQNQASNDYDSLIRQRNNTLINKQNRLANASLNAWNNLSTVEQIKVIQKLVYAIPDGKIGPQTLGKIFMALNQKSGEIDPRYMREVSWEKGKPGIYQNI